jgi:hypothetical protein
MTIPSSTRRNDYVGNGGLAAYDYTFAITSKNDLTIEKQDTSGNVSTLVVDLDYTVAGAGLSAGGTITLTAGNLPNGYKLSIRDAPSVEQDLDLRNRGGFFPEEHEAQFDYLTRIARNLLDRSTRSIRFPSVDGLAINATLPPAAQRASKFLACDAQGGVIASVGPAGVPVTAFIATLVDDVDQATARATLDTPGKSVDNVVSGIWTYLNTLPIRLQSAFPNIQFRDTDLAVDAGGLWRIEINGDLPRVVRNTAAAGDFSTNQVLFEINPNSGNPRFTLSSTDGGAAGGPVLTLDRSSSSSAVSDVLGIYSFGGRDSNGNGVTYGNIFCSILDPTDGSEDGLIQFQAIVNGVLTTLATVGTSGLHVAGAIDATGSVFLGDNVGSYFRGGRFSAGDPFLYLAASESGANSCGIKFQVSNAGSLLTALQIGSLGGLVAGNPTNGDKGPGTGNFAAPVYINDKNVIQILDRDVTSHNVVNTITETSVYSFSVPGGSLSTNRQIRLHLVGDVLNNSAGTLALQIKIKYGATTVATFAGSVSNAGGANRAPIEVRCTIDAANATNAQVSFSSAVMPGNGVNNSTNGVADATFSIHHSSHLSMAEDSTAAKTLSVTYQWNGVDVNASARAFATQVELC